MAEYLTDEQMAQMESAQSSGDVLSDAQIAKLEAEEAEYDSPILAGTLGAARGATLGLSDVAAAGLGYSDQIKKLQEYNPVSSTVGEVAGAVGSVAYGVGPASLLSRGAQAAVAKTILREGVKETAKRAILAGGVAAGLEGAGAGLGQTVSEIALSQKSYTPEQVGEKLIANVGMGFLLGGSLGAGMSAVPQAFKGIKNAIKKPVADGVETLGDDAAGALEAVDNTVVNAGETLGDDIVPDAEKFGGRGVLDKAVPNADDASIALQELGADAETAKTLINNEKDFLVRSVGESDTMASRFVNKDKQKFQSEVISKLKGELKSETELSAKELGEDFITSLKEDIKANKGVFKQTFGSREADLKRIVPNDSELVKTLGNLRSTEAFQSVSSSPAKRKAMELDRLISNKAFKSAAAIDQEISKLGGLGEAARRAGNNSEAFAYGELQDTLKSLQDRSVLRSAVEQTGGDKKLARQVVNDFRSVRRSYREFAKDLQDIAGTAKKKIKNPAQFSQFLDTLSPEEIGKKFLNNNLKDSSRLMAFQKRFPEKFEKFRQRYVVDLYESSVKDGELKLVDFINKANKLQPEVMDAVFTPEAARSLRNLDKVNKFNSSMLKTPKQLESSLAGGLLRMGDRIGGELKDVAFLAVSRALGYLDDGARAASDIGNKTLVAKPQVNGAVKKIENSIKGSVKKFIDSSSTIKKVIPQGAVQGLLGSKEDNKKRMDTFAMYATNPETFMNKVMENTSGIEQYSPATAQAMMNSAMEAVSFLNEKMPKKDQNLDEELFGVIPDYSDYEMATFNRYARAVENPLTILQDIEMGMLTPQAVEAVSSIYPTILEEIQSQVMDDLSSKKPKLNYGQKIQLSMLLGFPVSDTMKPEFIAAMQKPKEPQGQEQPQARQNAGLSKIAQNYTTPVQRIAQS